jgi:oligoribonuclease
VDRLVWIDCEMTGLDLENDRLIEVAVLITDGELNLVDEGLDVVINAPDDLLDNMVPVVTKMHADSGLTDAVRASTLTVPEAEQQVLDYIKQFVPERRKAPLCGNSIATDRSFLARDMKELDDWLHYRMVDVSSVKELARRWYPRAYYASPEKNGGHRALADILESVEELRYYRQAIFVPDPGPSSEEARAIATALRGEPTESSAPPSDNSGADGPTAG